MTDPTPPVVPAAWYPDPAGTPRQRWWDGTQWTEHYQQPYATTAAVLKAPDGTKPYTVWIWLILVVIALQIAPIFTTNYVDSAVSTTTTSQGAYATMSTPQDLVLNLINLLAVAVLVVFAYLDWRALKRADVPRPFHWGWMFFALITPLVYVIGRTVVVRRRTGSGMAPLWIAIGLTILTWIVTIVVVIPVFIAAFQAAMESYPGR